MKKVLQVLDSPPTHWVGDGFPVRSIFNYSEHGRLLSPFLLFDHTAPTYFEAAAEPRGVGQHPHRGFETVSIVFQGELEHRDSGGGTGTVAGGDVQWMTAGSGVLHDEFHSRAFTARGGFMEGVQLWVNLPAKDKFAEPRYQTLRASSIPIVDLPNAAGSVRVVAGRYAEVRSVRSVSGTSDCGRAVRRRCRFRKGTRWRWQSSEDRSMSMVGRIPQAGSSFSKGRGARSRSRQSTKRKCSC